MCPHRPLSHRAVALGSPSLCLPGPAASHPQGTGSQPVTSLGTAGTCAACSCPQPAAAPPAHRICRANTLGQLCTIGDRCHLCAKPPDAAGFIPPQHSSGRPRAEHVSGDEWVAAEGSRRAGASRLGWCQPVPSSGTGSRASQGSARWPFRTEAVPKPQIKLCNYPALHPGDSVCPSTVGLRQRASLKSALQMALTPCTPWPCRDRLGWSVTCPQTTEAKPK